MSRPVALIVDDVPDLLQLMAEAVELALPDHEVRTAPSAPVAQQILGDLQEQGARLTLLVADQTLVGLTGLDLMEDAIKNDAGTALLLITGRAPGDVEDQARRIGARVLWKPFRINTLVQTVREVVGARNV
jgi:DNA-binding NtrC family response regulator